MFASILKLAALLGFATAPASGVMPAAPKPEAPKLESEPDPDPMPAPKQQQAWRRSGLHSSPLAERRDRRSGRAQLMVLAAKPAAPKTSRRPKSAPRMGKRRPKPSPRSRHVWLASRSPAVPRISPTTVIALPGRRRRPGNPMPRMAAA